MEAFEKFEDFDDSGFRTFADVLAGRAASSSKPRAIDQKVKTGTVASLRLVVGPGGCSGVHCPNAAKHCSEKTCISRLEKETESLKSDNESKTIEVGDHLETIEGLLVEISAHCRTDSLYYPTMEESRSALDLALAENVDAGSCECVACKLSFEQKNAKMLKQKLKAVGARHKALDEYRRAHDKEALARTNEGYMKGGKYFTRVGGAKAKGVQALRPTLQLQNSYDVQNLTTNSMKERPLVGSGKKKNKKKRV